VAVSATFFTLGCGYGVWAAHIPVVVKRLNVEHAVVGMVLFAMAVGAIVAMPLTGWALGRLGSRRPTAALGLAFAVLSPWPVVSPTIPALFAAAVLFGASTGALDVAMNVQASAVEKARGLPTMSSMHAYYSTGVLAGSALGGVLIENGYGNGSGAIVVSASLFVLAIGSAMNLLPDGPAAGAGPRFVVPPLAILGLGAIVFFGYAAEGAVADWSALYLSTIKKYEPAQASSGVIAFSFAMVCCRLLGDAVVHRIGPVFTVLGGGLLIAFGIFVAVLAPAPLLSAFGFGIVGLGAANIVPVTISAAARAPAVEPGVAVAATTSMGYAGFLAAPPLLGLVASRLGLQTSLALIAFMGIVIAGLASSVARR
jgi:predicted MFS family arabinose efflux permease